LTVLAVASTVVTAGSQLYAGAAANAQANYEGKIADRNAQYEREAAKDAMSRRNVEQMRHWRRVSQMIGQQTAEQAGMGLDINFGSPSDIIDDTLMIGAQDSQTINENFAKEIKGYDINASNYTMQGRAARARGKQAVIGSYLGAAGTILGGASQIARMNASPSFGPSSQGFSGPPG
jgi:hypothetical protein